LEVQLAEQARVLEVAQFHAREAMQRATEQSELWGRSLERIGGMVAAARAEGWDAGAEDALRWAFRGGNDDDAIARYREQREGER
jgi:hypothetical protein